MLTLFALLSALACLQVSQHVKECRMMIDYQSRFLRPLHTGVIGPVQIFQTLRATNAAYAELMALDVCQSLTMVSHQARGALF